MTDEEIKLKILSKAIEENMSENELFELARERRYRINDLEKENAELKEQLEVTNKENERIRRTMLTYSECITEHQNTIKRKDEENEKIKKQWHDCFLSCSSPYCAGHFPAVKMQGELGNMSKREPELAE